MKKITYNRIALWKIVALVLAMCICLLAFCAAAIGFADKSGSDPAVADQRISLSDLMSRHGVDYAIGPTVTEFEKDNITYNNNYGIIADKYFSYENYLFIDTVDGKKTLHGWKNGIEPAYDSLRIKTDGTDSDGKVRIYSDKKYVIVLPDDVEVIGTSNYYYDGYFNYYGSYTKPTETTYTNFSFYWGINNDNRADNWCPRERLGGIYCGPKSKLSEISGVASGATVPKDRAESASSSADRKKQCDVARPALYACNNMRFCILPSGFTADGVTYKLNTIGRYAFGNCNQMRDVNIPNNVGTVGDYAFSACSQLAHITIPKDVSFGSNVFDGTSNLRDVVNHNSKFVKSDFSDVMNYTDSDSGSMLYAIGTKDGDDGTQAIYFCYNTNLGNSKALVTTNGKAETKVVGYSTNKWYAIGLAGLEDKQKQTIYEFPTKVTGTSDDLRRKDIIYDYINPDGTVHKNTLSAAIDSYDIAANCMYSTWCGNVIIPSSVTNIGDNAFNFCHLQYVEIGANTERIGYQSFYGNHGQMDVVGATSFQRTQYYYIHSNKITTIGNGAFNNGATLGAEATNRWFIFDSKADMDNNKTKYTSNKLTVTAKYEVPIYAVVESKSGGVKVNGDMDTLFRHDSDYDSVIAAGDTYTCVYTKRMGGQDGDFIKLKSGRWAKSSVVQADEVPPALPTLAGNAKTVWYSGVDYKTVLSDLKNVYPNNPTGDKYCIFTKKISMPNVTPNEWTYTEEMDSVANADEYSFINLLGLNANDYDVELVSYINPQHVSGNPTYVNAAGEYTLHIKMNSAFGEWENASDDKYNTTATVAQKEIDLYNLANIPEFYAKGSSVNSPLLGNSTTLYMYGNAWYTDEQETAAGAEATVSNSYIVYTASAITVEPESDWSMYNISAANNVDSDSGSHTATFSLSVKNSNYVFAYNGQPDGFGTYNISFKYKDSTSATLDKVWYIVQPLNWLVDRTTGGSGNSSINNQYVLAVSALSGMVSSWTYEDDDITIHIPKLAKGDGQNALSMSITLNGSELIKNASVDDLPKYLNSAMPAGEYDILIHAEPVTVTDDGNETTYPAFNTSFKITVKPKQLDTSAIMSALTGSDSERGTRFEFAHDGELHLHNDVSGLLAELNGELNNSFNSAVARDSGNYWLGLSGAEFEQYFGLATLKYNLDALQTNAYFTADELASKTNAPKGVGKYVVYYSISAPNYVTLGGAQDTSRRNYRFTTVIYREISALTVAAAINGNTYRYNGSNVFATVGYSQYYSTAYKDVGGYLNAGNHTVTLTINDKELTRWQDETGDGVTLDLENGTATIMYNVQKAENKWIYAPSVVRWTWGEYNPDLNVISAMASFGTQDIVYSILDANKRAISVEVEADGTTKTVSLSDFDEVTEDIAAALGKLSAGTYFLRGRIDGTGNYTALSDLSYDHEFAVIKVSNTWNVTPNMTNWQYAGFSADGNFIVGEPGHSVDGKTVKYGVFTTEPADSSALNVAGKNIFTDIKSVADYLAGLSVGEYWLAAYYEGTENYKELFHTTSFRVSKATNNSWKDDRMPEISDWTYGGYADRLFTSGEATFGSTLYTVQTVGQDGNSVAAVVGYVRLSYAELAAKLSKLDAGRYNLYVTTNSTDNYAAAKALNIRFAIAKADNVWKGKAPTIEGWVYGSAANTPSASDTVYANGGITKEFYLARMVNNVWIADEAKGVIKDITKADAGMYVYIVTARASVNYGELKVVVPFEIEKRVNAWKTSKEPTLFYNWLSGEADYTFKVPEAEAHSELMRFNILNMANGAAQNGLDTKTFLTELKKLTSGVFQVRMYIGDDIIYGGESEANKAALAAYAKNYYYLSSTCEIQIAPRVNSFKYEPRISTILYLGDKNIWAKPTAEATLADSEIVFTYKDAVTGKLLGNEIPTTPGRYVLTATATASFSEPIERSVEFRVALSPNSWISAPTIDGWQEDNKPNNPTANAHNGSDKVVFTYANVNTPNVILTEKPTAAGEYIMYAVLEMDGYETLKAEYRFTIAPAFDTQLVTVAIALAVIACLLCGVVLYFAIRRYKEN